MSLYSILFLALGIIAAIFFHGDIFIPIWMSVIAFVGVSLYLLQQFRRKRLGVLMLLLWVVYGLPFIHVVPYLWFDFYGVGPLRLWILAVNSYLFDEQIVRLTAMIGAVGGLGIALGVSLNNNKIVRDTGLNCRGDLRRARTLSMPVWFVWVLLGVVFTWLSAPQDTIFTAVYTASKSILQGANFSSAWMISYVILIFAMCDAIMDRNPVRRLLKRQVILGAIVFVVVFFKLLRGDRESIPLVFGALLVYFYWAAPLTRRGRLFLPWTKIALGGFLLFIVSIIVGSMRHSLVGIDNLGDIISLFDEMAESGQFGVSHLIHGTWSAVLLTPLSVAGDHINGLLSLKFGQTYLDLLLSIPPGFVADAFGYVRPINSFSGPAWEMRHGIGGTHATVVPFMNFRMIGVFLIPALWAYLFTWFEKRTLKQLSVNNLALLCAAAMVSPHWLWYGEKYVFNALIIWFLLAISYRISLSLSSSLSARRLIVSSQTVTRD